MKLRHITTLICLLSGTLIFTVAGPTEPVQVMVSILPQKYFVKKIAGEMVKVSVMVPPGSNPATYEPKSSQMKALSHSQILFTIGVPFEKTWLAKMKAVNRKMQVVHTDQSIKKLAMVSRHHHSGNSPLKSGKAMGKAPSRNGGFDPHIWLSPPLVKMQAQAIADALIKIDPGNERFYSDNLKAFQIELERLDSEIREMFAVQSQGKEFLVFHPSWGYFAKAYGLEQVPVEIEGKEPSAIELARLIEYSKSKGIKVIFVQPQFSTKIAEATAKEIGAQIVIADPLNEDWMENLREVAAKFKAALTLSVPQGN